MNQFEVTMHRRPWSTVRDVMESVLKRAHIKCQLKVLQFSYERVKRAFQYSLRNTRFMS